MEWLIAVDEADREIGRVEKMEAHRLPVRHRAVSGFAFAPDGRLLLQRRATGKYHCGGLIANTCCSHPRPGETAVGCMERRMWEELGSRVHWQSFGTHHYCVHLPGGLWENEVVHLFAAIIEEFPEPDPAEVAEVLWADPSDLTERTYPVGDLAPWFRNYLEQGLVGAAFAASQRRASA